MADERIELLRVHKSTNGLDAEQLHRLADHVEIVRCQEGDIIHRLDNTVEALLLVVTGRLKMSTVSATGVEKTVQYVGRDDQFGLLALANEEPFPIQVTAEQNAKLLRIPKDAALQLLSDLPLWGRNLLRSVGPRLLESVLNVKQPRRRRVIALIHISDKSRQLTSAILERLSEIGEQVGLLSDNAEVSKVAIGEWRSLLDSAERPIRPEDIRGTFARWSDMDRLVLDASDKTVAKYLPELTGACEAVFWICFSENADRVKKALTPLIQSSPGSKDKLFVIRILDGSEQVAPLAPELDSLCKRDFKLHWNGSPDGPVSSRQAGIERIVHFLRGVSIGLALGGGAARGMAHLGVLQVLDSAGITIDCLSGTSAGALTGIPYAAGHSADYLVSAFANDLKPAWYYRLLPYGDAWYVLGKYRLGLWDGMLRKYLHSWQLEQLANPFSSVTVDLVQGQQVVREKGDATHAILESINLPGLARPICRDSMTLVDGGVLNVVPADVLVNQGANIVISSDVAARIRFEFAGNRPETPIAEMKVPSSVQTLVRMRTVQDRNIRSMGGSTADIIIEPDVSQVSLTDFKRAPKIAEFGREAAEAALPEIQRVLNRVDPQLFPSVE